MYREKQKILLVDDNAVFIDRLALLLRESGSGGEIFTSGTFDDALFCIANYEPDIVFLDIHLQNKSGIDLLKMIRLSGSTCKVVMLTNETKNAYKRQCERLGSIGFLDKSNEFECIPELIRQLNYQLA
jgi:DNA-binding NarL/FixJ family response regulator